MYNDEVNTLPKLMTAKIDQIGISFLPELVLIQEGFDSLDGMAFACGPGSYTALRITASFLKAIAEVKKLPLIAISNLLSIAHEASQWIDEADTNIYVALELIKRKLFL